MTGVRRSGRISREIPILLLGTNTSGRVFSEQTHTLVLSRHGAGILSRNKFNPDEVLTLRLLDSGREAEIRLVGNLGEGPGGANVYGVAFCDPALDFWQMEFPPPEPCARPATTNLECSFCGSRNAVEQSEVEADVSSSASPFFATAIPAAKQLPGSSPQAILRRPRNQSLENPRLFRRFRSFPSPLHQR